jgi:L-amino acid N-acyltransferase YncA
MPSPSLLIRPATPADVVAVVRIACEVVQDGTTYAFAPDTSDDELRGFWFAPAVMTFVACEGDEVLGCYLLRPNQLGRGAHVANASYAVASEASGRGVGRAMGEHSLREAAARGYGAMQFNYVVSTNAAAIALWTKLGFAVVGRSPRSFDHPKLGYVDTLIMHRSL